jgi:outer membrane protein OmpA-like peptidoglycan-associated protein
MAGLTGLYIETDVNQERNRAENKTVGLGFYGGLIKENFDVKLMFGGNYNDYDTKRYIPFADRTAEGKFSSVTAYADAEAGIKMPLSSEFYLRPFAGANAVFAQISSFEEKGAGSLNLDVDRGDFTRTSARGGLGVNMTAGRFNAYISGAANLVLSGREAEIDSVFYGTDQTFKSKSAQMSDIRYEGSVGLGYKITRDLQIFANGRYMTSQDYTNYYGNAGLRWSFCGVKPKVVEIIKTVEVPVTVIQTVEKPAPVQVGSKIEISSGYFAHDSYALNAQLEKYLEQKAEELSKLDYSGLVITGHTDNIGSDKYNKKLSEQRAKAVADFLITGGVPADKIIYEGKGFSEPAYPNDTEKGRSYNRRVEILVK